LRISSGYGASRFASVILDHVPGHQRSLRQGEDQRERQETEHLEIHPHIGCLGTPDDLVEDGKEDEEQTPTQGELAPAVVVHSDRFTHDEFEEKLAKSKAAKEKRAEQSIDQRHLHLDEDVILK